MASEFRTIEIGKEDGIPSQVIITVEEGGNCTVNIGESIQCHYSYPEWFDRAAFEGALKIMRG